MLWTLPLKIIAVGVRRGVSRRHVDQVRCHQARRAGNDVLVRRRCCALDDADRVDNAVVELEGVEIADNDDVLTRSLMLLDEVSQELRLLLAFGAGVLAGARVVRHAVERAQMVDDHGHRIIRSAGALDARAQHQRRTIVQFRLASRTRLRKGRRETDLRNVGDIDLRWVDEERHVDTAGVVALREIRNVVRIGLACGDGVGTTRAARSLSVADVLDLLHRENVGGGGMTLRMASDAFALRSSYAAGVMMVAPVAFLVVV